MSNPPSEATPPVQTSQEDVRRMVTIEVGQRLKLSREEQQLSLESVSDQIKLSPTQLKALESGQWQALPNDTLALAFLRQYAQHLGADIGTTVEQLKSDALNFHQPLTFPDPAIAPNRKWAIAAAALFVLLLLTWNLLGPRTAPLAPEKSPPILVEKSHSPIVIPNIEAEKKNQHGIEKPTTKPIAPVEKVKEVMSPYSNEIDSNEIAADITINKTIIEAKTPSPVAASHEKKSPPPVAEPLHQFSFYAADERVWLLIETPDGEGGHQRLREVILRPQHSIEITQKEPLLFVSVGNAGGIKITVEGKTLYDFGQFGKHGMVIRHREIRAPSAAKPAPKVISEAASQ